MTTTSTSTATPPRAELSEGRLAFLREMADGPQPYWLAKGSLRSRQMNRLIELGLVRTSVHPLRGVIHMLTARGEEVARTGRFPLETWYVAGWDKGNQVTVAVKAVTYREAYHSAAGLDEITYCARWDNA